MVKDEEGERKCTGEEEGMFVSKGFGQSVLVGNATRGGTNASGRLSATQEPNSHRSISKAVLEPVDHYEL